jgi:hypothetical protein
VFTRDVSRHVGENGERSDYTNTGRVFGAAEGGGEHQGDRDQAVGEEAAKWHGGGKAKKILGSTNIYSCGDIAGADAEGDAGLNRFFAFARLGAMAFNHR